MEYIQGDYKGQKLDKQLIIDNDLWIITYGKGKYTLYKNGKLISTSKEHVKILKLLPDWKER